MVNIEVIIADLFKADDINFYWNWKTRRVTVLQIQCTYYNVCLLNLILYNPSTIFQSCRDGSSTKLGLYYKY